MRTIRIIEHISLDGVIQAPGGPEEDPNGFAYGGWAARVETTDEFAPALRDALGREGVRLLHLVSDIERLNAAGSTVTGLRNRGK